MSFISHICDICIGHTYDIHRTRMTNQYYNERYNPSAPFVRSRFLVSYRIRSAIKTTATRTAPHLKYIQGIGIRIKSLSKYWQWTRDWIDITKKWRSFLKCQQHNLIDGCLSSPRLRPPSPPPTCRRWLRLCFKVMPDKASLRHEFRVSTGRKAILWRKMHAKWRNGGFFIDFSPLKLGTRASVRPRLA